MQRIIQNEKYGEIKYTEGFWTGKPNLEINGVPLEKTGKRQFQYMSGEAVIPVSIKGNLTMGATVSIGGDTVVIEPKPKWYELTLSLFIFIFILVWGNVVALCKIFPLVGGAIGGLISGAFAMLNLFMMRKVKNIGLKLLIFLGFFALTIGLCYLIAFAFLSAAK